MTRRGWKGGENLIHQYICTNPAKRCISSHASTKTNSCSELQEAEPIKKKVNLVKWDVSRFPPEGQRFLGCFKSSAVTCLCRTGVKLPGLCTGCTLCVYMIELRSCFVFSSCATDQNDKDLRSRAGFGWISKSEPVPSRRSYLVEGGTQTGAPGVARCAGSRRGRTTVAWLPRRSSSSAGSLRRETTGSLRCAAVKRPLY